MRFHLSLRGTNIVSNEAIHHVSNPKIFNGEIQDDRLPRVINHARNDASCVISFMRHYRLPRIFIKNARNGAYQLVIARNEMTKQSIILHKLTCNGILKARFLIVDCHSLLQRLRKDASCVISFMRHYRLPRVINHARNDKNQSVCYFVIARNEAIHNPKSRL